MQFKKSTEYKIKALVKIFAIFALAYFLCGVVIA